MKLHQSCVRRQRYRFLGRFGTSLVWERKVPGDSRAEQISCSADWFYAQMTGEH